MVSLEENASFQEVSSPIWAGGRFHEIAYGDLTKHNQTALVQLFDRNHPTQKQVSKQPQICFTQKHHIAVAVCWTDWPCKVPSSTHILPHWNVIVGLSDLEGMSLYVL